MFFPAACLRREPLLLWVPARRALVPEERGLCLPPWEGRAWSLDPMDVLNPRQMQETETQRVQGCGWGHDSVSPESALRDGSGQIVLMGSECKEQDRNKTNWYNCTWTHGSGTARADNWLIPFPAGFAVRLSATIIFQPRPSASPGTHIFE